MYRRSHDADVVVEELPFGPTAGVWHDGRLYWTCFPFGLGSWAPCEDPTFALPELSLYGIQPDGDSLVLHSRVRGVTGTTERRFPAHAWRWRAGHALEAIEPGELGPQSSVAIDGEWTATAHPEADVVMVSSPSAARPLPCASPYSVAWAGRSLVVCTSAAEVLLFEGVR